MILSLGVIFERGINTKKCRFGEQAPKSAFFYTTGGQWFCRKELRLPRSPKMVPKWVLTKGHHQNDRKASLNSFNCPYNIRSYAFPLRCFWISCLWLNWTGQMFQSANSRTSCFFLRRSATSSCRVSNSRLAFSKST